MTRHARTIEELQRSRRPLVRLEAAEALARDGVGHASLRAAARRERNEVVLVTICESLTVLGDAASVPMLLKLARNHASSLVRAYAVWGVSEILERDAIPLLQRLDRKERSRRVRVRIKTGLLKNGRIEELPAVLELLKSRDYLVRTPLANFFTHNAKIIRDRKLVVQHLQAALAVEESRAAAEAIERALARLSSARRRKPRA